MQFRDICLNIYKYEVKGSHLHFINLHGKIQIHLIFSSSNNSKSPLSFSKNLINLNHLIITNTKSNLQYDQQNNESLDIILVYASLLVITLRYNIANFHQLQHNKFNKPTSICPYSYTKST